MLKSVIAVSVGGTLGCLLRWWLGMLLNSLFPTIPPGTVAANFIGAYVIGLAIAFFAGFSTIAPEWRLFVITGFCGGLTTFSTFSAEITALAQQGRLGMVAGAIGLHVGGSLALTLLGIASMQWFIAR